MSPTPNWTTRAQPAMKRGYHYIVCGSTTQSPFSGDLAPSHYALIGHPRPLRHISEVE
jgi:hypothetical protein